MASQIKCEIPIIPPGFSLSLFLPLPDLVLQSLSFSISNSKEKTTLPQSHPPSRSKHLLFYSVLFDHHTTPTISLLNPINGSEPVKLPHPLHRTLVNHHRHLRPRGTNIQIDDSQPQLFKPKSSDPSSSGLVNRMPQLSDPKVIAAMIRTMSEIAKTRSVLNALGD